MLKRSVANLSLLSVRLFACAMKNIRLKVASHKPATSECYLYGYYHIVLFQMLNLCILAFCLMICHSIVK